MWESLVNPIANLLGKFIVNKDEQMQLAHEIATLAQKQIHEQNLAQIEVNKVEAASDGFFRGGWRPATGWICASALAWHYLLQPVVLFLLLLFKVSIPALPVFEMETLMTVLFGLLGLGGFRTLEKIKK